MLGDNIKRIRLEKKFKQSDLAQKANISRVAVGNYERGDRTPNVDILKSIATALGVTVNVLMGEKNGMQNLIDDTIKYKNVTLEEVSSKTTISIEKIKQLYHGANYSVDDFNIIQNSFWGSYGNYENTCPRIMIEHISKNRNEEDKTINALFTILQHYYGHNISDVTDLSKTDFSKKKIIILNLDNKEIQYTREEINEFLKFVAISFPNFKLIKENLKDKK